MRKTMLAALAALCFSAFTFEDAVQAQAPPPQTTSAPPELVHAIAKQESGLNPLAVNVAGLSHYPATIAEAEAIILAAQQSGKSYDVGIMQVNRWWIDKYGIPPRDLLDPAINKAWGTWILSEEIARHGLTWVAVGKYHSPDLERGRIYSWLVYRHLAGIKEHSAGGKLPQEENHAAQKPTAASQSLHEGNGVCRPSGIRSQGRFIPLDVHTPRESWAAGEKH